MLDQDTHRKILFSILIDIYSGPLSKHLAFKGGTASYFFHKLPRFSTDLDFDVLHTQDHTLDSQLIAILQKYGKVKVGHNILLFYDDKSVNIKIDINRNIWQHNQYEMRNFYGVDITTQTPSTIFANKLVALYERFANRDIFDVWFFLKNSFDINDNIIKERTGKMTSDLMKKIVIKLQKLSKNYKLLDGLGEVLQDDKQKYFVDKKLLPELLSLLLFYTDSG